MASWDVTHYSSNTGNTLNSGVSIDNTRRLFNFGERIARIEPQQSIFFSYLSKYGRKPTDDKVFKMLEQRHQWQRRNFEMYESVTPGAEVYGTALDAGDDFKVCCKYDKYGRVTTTDQPCYFIMPGAILAIKGDDGNVYRFRVSSSATLTNASDSSLQGDPGADDVYNDYETTTNTGYTWISGEMITPIGGTAGGSAIGSAVTFADGNKGEVIGSAWPEASGAPEGWSDELYDREGYTQIFKTAIKLASGTSMATKHRGISDEFKRQWMEKLKEHKMDMEKAFLFGKGVAAPTGSDEQYTWGVLPYIETYSQNVFEWNYADFDYDTMMDDMQDFFAPELGNSGTKLVMASRKVINRLSRLGEQGFLKNTVGASNYRLDMKDIKGEFGHRIREFDVNFGYLRFVESPLIRGPWEDYAMIVDLKNVWYRPLIGNGNSRDTFIKTNVQENDVDGRKDMIITEAGLEVDLPETHGIIKFS
jgi:hypothetical protein